MAKNGKNGGGMLGPMKTAPSGNNLGPVKPSSHGPISPPDPLGFGHGKLRTGPSPTQRSQSHDKE